MDKITAFKKIMEINSRYEGEAQKNAHLCGYYYFMINGVEKETAMITPPFSTIEEVDSFIDGYEDGRRLFNEQHAIIDNQ